MSEYPVMSGAGPSFPGGTDASFAFGPEGRWRGYFGRDVLRGLMAGIDEFHVAKAGQRWFRVLGSALLGAFMWLDDPELVQEVRDLSLARFHQFDCALAEHAEAIRLRPCRDLVSVFNGVYGVRAWVLNGRDGG